MQGFAVGHIGSIVIGFVGTGHKGTSKYLEPPAELREAQVLIVLGRQGATKES